MSLLLFVNVSSYKYVPVDGKEVIYYKFDLSFKGKKWSIEHRYSECEIIVKELEALHGKIPHFPAKGYFALKTHEAIEERRKGLDYFFKEIIKREDINNNKLLLSFLGIPIDFKNSTEKEQLELIDSLENKVLAFRKLAICSKRNLIACILSDTSVISRFDSYFTNLKLPWNNKVEESEEIIFAVGRLELYSYSSSLNRKIKLDLLCGESYSAQAYTAKFSKNGEWLSVGCDDGSVHLYQINSNKQLITLFSDKVGKGRIIEIGFDTVRKYLHVFFDSGNILTVNLERKELLER